MDIGFSDGIDEVPRGSIVGHESGGFNEPDHFQALLD
jgi:hypothetical protein